jgi:hypothetical protein
MQAILASATLVTIVRASGSTRREARLATTFFLLDHVSQLQVRNDRSKHAKNNINNDPYDPSPLAGAEPGWKASMATDNSNSVPFLAGPSTRHCVSSPPQQ